MSDRFYQFARLLASFVSSPGNYFCQGPWSFRSNGLTPLLLLNLESNDVVSPFYTQLYSPSYANDPEPTNYFWWIDKLKYSTRDQYVVPFELLINYEIDTLFINTIINVGKQERRKASGTRKRCPIEYPLEMGAMNAALTFLDDGVKTKLKFLAANPRVWNCVETAKDREMATHGVPRVDNYDKWRITAFKGLEEILMIGEDQLFVQERAMGPWGLRSLSRQSRSMLVVLGLIQELERRWSMEICPFPNSITAEPYTGING